MSTDGEFAPVVGSRRAGTSGGPFAFAHSYGNVTTES